jgi:hypothetical protein
VNWTQRAFANYAPDPLDSVGIWTFDTSANLTGLQAGSISQQWSVTSPWPNVLWQAISLQGPNPIFVQANAQAVQYIDPQPNPNGFSMAISDPVTNGSTLVIDIFGFLEAQSNFAVTDSAGNNYTQEISSTYDPFGGHYWTSFVATNVIGGEITINVATFGTGGGSTGVLYQWSMAAHEYSGVSTVDSATIGHTLSADVTNPDVTDFSITTSQNSEILHLAVFDNNWEPLVSPAVSPTIQTTNTPYQPILLPPAIQPVNDKTLPIYSLNFPMRKCIDPCTRIYDLI